MRSYLLSVVMIFLRSKKSAEKFWNSFFILLWKPVRVEFVEFFLRDMINTPKQIQILSMELSSFFITILIKVFIIFLLFSLLIFLNYLNPDIAFLLLFSILSIRRLLFFFSFLFNWLFFWIAVLILFIMPRDTCSIPAIIDASQHERWEIVRILSVISVQFSIKPVTRSYNREYCNIFRKFFIKPQSEIFILILALAY